MSIASKENENSGAPVSHGSKKKIEVLDHEKKLELNNFSEILEVFNAFMILNASDHGSFFFLVFDSLIFS